eukprot:SM000140S00620  [mRNA]  locus=s140:361642:364306:+ [translate_table: standard]
MPITISILARNGSWRGRTSPVPAPSPAAAGRPPPHIVKETKLVTQAEDLGGHKIVNQYVREHKLGTGSYGKVVLHRNLETGKLYALKIVHKSRLKKLRVAPAETALMDVMREVAIMKQLDHPNIVNLEEVIDDPAQDKLYMVLEYVEGGCLFEGTGPPGGIGEKQARRYFRDTLAGLMYLHYHNVVHGDIKPENLLLGAEGQIKIGDFGVSHIFQDKNDELRRSPGTPVYTAPECCQGCAYSGKGADIWALGCTLYVFVTGQYPFVGASASDTFDKIVSEPLVVPKSVSQPCGDLLRELLEKDPKKRTSLEDVAHHPWVTFGYGPLQQQPYKGIFLNDEIISSAFSKSITSY